MSDSTAKAYVRPETVEQIAARARLEPDYLVLMTTSGILAAVAFLSDSVPLLVGSMIVAPVFAPLALIGFALVAGRRDEVRDGVKTVLAGLAIAMAAAMLTTWILNVTHVFAAEANLFDEHALLKERLSVGWFSVVSAVAAGVAGTIALARDRFDSLIGVLAALALVPAVAAAGIAFVSGDLTMGVGGLMLLAVSAGATVVTEIAVLRWFRIDRAAPSPSQRV